MRWLFVAGESVRWSPVHPAGVAVEPVRVCVAASDCDCLLHRHRQDSAVLGRPLSQPLVDKTSV